MMRVSRMQIKDKADKKLSKEEVMLNGNRLPKVSVIKHIADWARTNFVFQNGTVHLPNDCKLPVDNVDEELTNLNVFEKTNMRALEYLITCILAIGIKIGKEMAIKEMEDKQREE